jgi:methyl-accepting chemotaxis protein
VQIEENSTKLGTQNEYFANVFASMKDMTELLNTSVSAITTMGDAHSKQAEVIKKTVSINQDIAESIRNENEQFNSINAMVENNANDTAEVATQASAINEMVDEMSRILRSNE